MLKRFRIAILGAALFLSASSLPAAYAQPTDPLSVVTASETAVNAHDVEAALALFADDAVVKTPFNVYVGRDQIRRFLQGAVAQNVQDEPFGSPRVAGDTVNWAGKVSYDEWRKLGVAPLETLTEAVVQGGKIRTLSAEFTPEAAERLQAALSGHIDVSAREEFSTRRDSIEAHVGNVPIDDEALAQKGRFRKGKED